MALRLSRPTTVQAALGTLKQAYDDLKYIVSKKQAEATAADAAIERSEKNRDIAIKNANEAHDGVVTAQTSVKDAAAAEIKSANTVLKNLGKIANFGDDTE